MRNCQCINRLYQTECVIVNVLIDCIKHNAYCQCINGLYQTECLIVNVLICCFKFHERCCRSFFQYIDKRVSNTVGLTRRLSLPASYCCARIYSIATPATARLVQWNWIPLERHCLVVRLSIVPKLEILAAWCVSFYSVNWCRVFLSSFIIIFRVINQC